MTRSTFFWAIKWIIVSMFIIRCTENNNNSESASNQINKFDAIELDQIDILKNLSLVMFNDTAKWLLYSIHYSDSLRLRDINRTKIPLGFLKLNLTTVKLERDTLNLLYTYLYKDSILAEDYDVDRPPTASGVQIDTKKGSVIGFIVGEGVFNQKGPGSKYENIYQEELLNFVKNNKEKLDPWFKNEAEQHGILK
jgi:hypothetical protein